MRRRLVAVAAAALFAAGAALAGPAAASDDADGKDWICIGIIPPVDTSICPGSPFVLLPDPLVPRLPLG